MKRVSWEIYKVRPVDVSLLEELHPGCVVFYLVAPDEVLVLSKDKAPHQYPIEFHFWVDIVVEVNSLRIDPMVPLGGPFRVVSQRRVAIRIYWTLSKPSLCHIRKKGWFLPDQSWYRRLLRSPWATDCLGIFVNAYSITSIRPALTCSKKLDTVPDGTIKDDDNRFEEITPAYMASVLSAILGWYWVEDQGIYCFGVLHIQNKT